MRYMLIQHPIRAGNNELEKLDVNRSQDRNYEFKKPDWSASMEISTRYVASILQRILSLLCSALVGTWEGFI